MPLTDEHDRASDDCTAPGLPPLRVMIAVTHLLGSGHLARAALLAAAFRDAGHRVLLASGGLPAPHVAVPPAGPGAGALTVVQLPAVASDGADFARLLRPDGTPADAAWLEARAAALVAALRDLHPDVVITELYPLGRRSLAAEFRALLEAAAAQRPRPVILASVRDILAPPSKPARAAEAEATVAAFYDAVLVHADPARIPLQASWPVGPALAARLRYTGFIAPPPPGPPAAEAAGAILVSAGGGDVGAPLFDAALDAAAEGPPRRWRILAGGPRAAAECARLAARAAALGLTQVTVEPARRDFREMLAAAAASVSLCGYNTALDLLATGTPGVLVPFDAGRETEQGLRAAMLARRPHFAVVPAAALTGGAINAALARVLAAGRFAPDCAMLDGAAASVRLAEDLARVR